MSWLSIKVSWFSRSERCSRKSWCFLLAQIIAMCTKHYSQTNGNTDTTYTYTCHDNVLQCEVEPVNDSCGSGEVFPPVEDNQIFVWSNNRGYRSYHTIFSHKGKMTIVIRERDEEPATNSLGQRTPSQDATGRKPSTIIKPSQPWPQPSETTTANHLQETRTRRVTSTTSPQTNCSSNSDKTTLTWMIMMRKSHP